MPTVTKNFTCPTTGHGVIVLNNSNWTTLRNSSAGNTENNQGLITTTFGGGLYYLYRVFLPFDTRTIPLSATIVSWKIKLRRNDSINPFTNTNNTTVEILPSTQSDPENLVVGDYDAITFSSRGSINFSSTSNNTVFEINGTNNDVIIKNGWTKLAATTGLDLNNVAPTSDNTLAYDQAGTANEPLLEVTYKVKSGFLAFI